MAAPPSSELKCMHEGTSLTSRELVEVFSIPPTAVSPKGSKAQAWEQTRRWSTVL